MIVSALWRPLAGDLLGNGGRAARGLRLLLLALVILLPRPAAAQASLAGVWDWGAGAGVVELFDDGSGHDSRGNTVHWSAMDPPAYRFVWSHGYTDEALLSADGRTLELVNNAGLRFTATRRGLPRDEDETAFAATDIAGSWNWTITSAIVTILADGSGRDPEGHALQWTLVDAATRTYTLKWSHGYVDTAVLSVDASRLTLTNNAGASFTATRIGPPPDEGVGGPLDLNGSWGNGLLHVWQDGTQIRITASWKREDGVYVVIYGEGRLNGNVVTMDVEYSPMAHGKQPIWHTRYVVSADGNSIDATYTTDAGATDHRVYARDP